MRQVLNLSYNNLPHRLKTCLLYIAIYPEDYIIRKADLLRQWVAEGFIGKIHGQYANKVAGSCFNELVNRSMIQPTAIGFDGEVIRCKVHDMILDLIRLKSEEEKFLGVVDDLEGMTTALRSKIRRLFLQLDYGANEGTIEARLSMPHIRSLARFKFSMYELKSIRVLNVDCQGARMGDRIDITPICKLFHLRYLSISSSEEHLETLKLDTDITAMPSDIVDLPCLLHLHVPMGTRLPNGIRRMKALRTLVNFDVHMNSMDNLTGLSELANLRSLHFCCDDVEHTTSQRGIFMNIFWCSVAKLLSCNLRNLGSCSNIFSPPFVELGSPSTSNSESNLEELHVATTWMFPRVPTWISQHQKLWKLGICVEKMMQEDFDLLAGLPNLLHLWLWIRKSPEMRIIIHGGVMAFKLLKYLRITCFAPCLTFTAGAMPKLQTFELNIHEDGAERHGPSTIEGVEHLPRLRQVDVGIYFEGDDTELRRRAADAEAILMNAISVYPGHLSIKIDQA